MMGDEGDGVMYGILEEVYEVLDKLLNIFIYSNNNVCWIYWSWYKVLM